MYAVAVTRTTRVLYCTTIHPRRAGSAGFSGADLSEAVMVAAALRGERFEAEDAEEQ